MWSICSISWLHSIVSFWFSSLFSSGFCGLTLHIVSTVLHFKNVLSPSEYLVILMGWFFSCNKCYIACFKTILMFTSFLFPLLLSLDSITHNDDHSLHTPLISLLPFPSIMLEWQNHRLSYTNPICFIGIILCWVGCALNLRQQTLSNSPVLHNLSTFLQPIVCSIL